MVIAGGIEMLGAIVPVVILGLGGWMIVRRRRRITSVPAPN
jgi:hypothetical protein